MKIISIKVLLALTIISFLSTNAFAETNVTDITIYSDSSWKVLDAKVNGWASIDFDDSYWLNAEERDSHQEGYGKARIITYPEKPSSPPFYFRKTFELTGTEIMSSKIFQGCCNHHLYVNDNYVGFNLFDIDITQYLKIGKNVIAVENPPGYDDYLGIAKIRVVSASTSSPSPTLTSTIIPTPTTATLQHGISGQTSKSASVSLTGEKTDVVFGEDILLKLSAVNLITKPVMHVQVIILLPSGMSVTSSEFSKSGTNQFTTNYELDPGDGKDIEVKIRPNQAGDFNVNGRIVYYFGDEKDKAEDHTLNLPIKVRKGPDDSAQTPIPNPTKSPGFETMIGIIGILFAVFLKKRQ
jgi:hypothetical protein